MHILQIIEIIVMDHCLVFVERYSNGGNRLTICNQSEEFIYNYYYIFNRQLSKDLNNI